MADSAVEQRFAIPGGEILYKDSPTDAELFGFRLTEIFCASLSPDAIRQHVPNLLRELTKTTDCLVTTRLPADATAHNEALAACGFYLADSQIHLSAKTDRLTPSDPVIPFPVRLIQIDPSRNEEVAELAGRTFDADRLHLDPHVPASAVDERYRRWIRGAGPDGSFLLVFEEVESARLLAFLHIRGDDTNNAHFVLGGVDRQHRAAKVATAFIEQCALECKRRGFESVSTIVALNNLGLIRSYIKLGFLPTEAKMVFHWFGRSD